LFINWLLVFTNVRFYSNLHNDNTSHNQLVQQFLLFVNTINKRKKSTCDRKYNAMPVYSNNWIAWIQKLHHSRPWDTAGGGYKTYIFHNYTNNSLDYEHDTIMYMLSQTSQNALRQSAPIQTLHSQLDRYTLVTNLDTLI
jgi:hypothetical protein